MPGVAVVCEKNFARNTVQHGATVGRVLHRGVRPGMIARVKARITSDYSGIFRRIIEGKMERAFRSGRRKCLIINNQTRDPRGISFRFVPFCEADI